MKVVDDSNIKSEKQRSVLLYYKVGKHL